MDKESTRTKRKILDILAIILVWMIGIALFCLVVMKMKLFK
jgi:hypothetical protein